MYLQRGQMPAPAGNCSLHSGQTRRYPSSAATVGSDKAGDQVVEGDFAAEDIAETGTAESAPR